MISGSIADFILGNIIGGSLIYIIRKQFADGIVLPLLLWLLKPLKKPIKRWLLKTERDVAVYFYYRNKRWRKG